MELKAEVVGVDNIGYLKRIYISILISIFFLLPGISLTQDIPQDELDVNLSTYFDNFRVDVIYPSVKLTKKVTNSTSVSGRYLTDIISAASMRTAWQIDGLTTATTKKTGGARVTPNELRHEFDIGIVQKIKDGTISLNGIYSIEHDYSSKTFSADLEYPFAKKNTVLQIGFLGSFDKVFPVIWTWTKDRNTLSFSTGITQILSKILIAQLNFSYTAIRGYQLDGYQVVRIVQDSVLHVVEPNEPDVRIRRALGIRSNISLSKSLTMQLGYRYYWDTWDVRSHTITTNLSKILNSTFSISLDLRNYFQTRAYFFKPEYTQIEQYMTVNSYLNSGYTNEISLNLSINGNKKINFPLLNKENVQLNTTFGFYHRYTDSPDWFSRYLHLYAYLFNIGIRYFL